MVESNEFDAIVVGGGPGGSVASAYMTKAGLKVLLLEKQKFPRDKTCGDAVSGKSMGILRELGWDKDLEKVDHAKVFGVIFSSPNGKQVEIPFGKADNPSRSFGYVSRRNIADNVWFQNAKKSVTKCIENFTVTDVLKEKDYVVGVKGKNANNGKEEEYRAKIVIGADGASSVIAKQLNVVDQDPDHWVVALRAYYEGIENLTQNIELHFFDSIIPGYFWIFPVENGQANVGIGILKSEVSKKGLNLKKLMLEAIEKEPIIKERFKNAKLTSNIMGWNLPLGSNIWKNHGNGYMLIGDASSLIDPFSGEGQGNAMLSAKIAADYATRALKEENFSKEFFAGYDKDLRKRIEPEIKTSHRLQKIGRYKMLLNFIVGKAASSDEVAKVISSMLSEEERKHQFFSPLFYLKLLFS